MSIANRVLLGFIFVGLSTATALVESAVASKGPHRFVSMVQLIALPERFEGEPIILSGVLGPKGDAVYLNPDAQKFELSEDSIELDFGSFEEGKKNLALRKKWVQIEGKFFYSKDRFVSRKVQVSGLESLEEIQNKFDTVRSQQEKFNKKSK